MFMKRKIILIIVLVALVAGFQSCIETPSFDADLLIGKWSRPSPFATPEYPGDEYYRYDEGGLGVTWDTSDDVAEEEAQKFTWSVNGSRLTLVHEIEMGGSVTKIYTLSTLTFDKLIYKDEFGKVYTFQKVQ